MDCLPPTATRVINFLTDCPDDVLDSGRTLLALIESSMSSLTGAAAEDAEDAFSAFQPFAVGMSPEAARGQHKSPSSATSAS
eukprot:scaffold121961_cov21-Tisochrysis_lutea.AAC.1